jgi:hypothetical protein
MRRSSFAAIAAMGLVVAAAAVPALGANRGSAAPSAPRCSELLPHSRHLCEGPGVTCSSKPDDHVRWEAVFATEPTLAGADQWRRTAENVFSEVLKIEGDVRCSNGYGVYEVGLTFGSRAEAARLVEQWRQVGFTAARVEPS